MARQLYAEKAQGFEGWQNSAYIDKNDTTANTVAVFRDSQDDVVTMAGVMPIDYNIGDITFYIHWASWTATVGSVVWEVAFERFAQNGNPMTSLNFASAKTVTQACSATLAAMKYASIGFTNAEAAGIQPGESFRIRLRRLGLTNPGGADTLVGVANVSKVLFDED